ncbi:MAG: RHS repeat-associated core domain-containing protein [Flavobacteriaceae bacterium]|nr:RHS repeat-associated core domain-containing protein [Flavobacteriaceae bacterium]
MKKILISIAFLILAINAFAQTTYEQNINWQSFTSSPGGGGGVWFKIINNNTITLKGSAGFATWSLKTGQIVEINSPYDLPDLSLGYFTDLNGNNTSYQLSLQNNWIVVSSSTNESLSNFSVDIEINNLELGDPNNNTSLIISPSSDENYILTLTPNKSIEGSLYNNLSSNMLKDGVNGSISYFDGLGRSIQNIGVRQGGDKEDIVAHFEYDSFGRQSKEYLPYADVSNNGLYRTDALLATNNYYKSNKYVEDIDINDPNPFVQKYFQPSSLNRVIEQVLPGKSWKKGTSIDVNGHSNGHTIKFGYHTNSNNEVRKFETTHSISNNTYIPSLSFSSINSGFYKYGQLYKTITKDENWKTSDGLNKTVEEFKDKLGRVILKRTYNGGQKYDTYYVYDDYGNLTYVIPPKAEGQNSVPNSNVLNELCYQYIYDNKNRLVEKKIPGKGKEYIVYNKLDQPILTQDSKLKLQNKWLFTKYDIYGRVAFTGITNSSLNRVSMQIAAKQPSKHYVKRSSTAVSLGGTTIYYNNNGTYPSTLSEILTVNYYDDYSFSSFPGSNPTTVYDVTPSTKVKGLLTGSMTKVLETNDWIVKITKYDDKGRPIFLYVDNNYLHYRDYIESKFDFAGNIVEMKSRQAKGFPPLKILFTTSVVNKYEYDHINRLKKQTQGISGSNNTSDELIVENEYDELGYLEKKGVGNVATSTQRLQNINYKYNIRGWLKSINDINNLSDDLFAYKINYDKQETNYGASALYNGNISETLWKSKNDNKLRSYAYGYDALNRISLANYKAVSENHNFSVFNVWYDKNGNITGLKRNYRDASGNSQLMDNLVYSIDSGNKLLKVADNANSLHKINGFKDGVNTGNDFAYDINGNLTKDLNKGIGTASTNGITYNHLNLPIVIGFGNNNKIEYFYDAVGTKYKKKVLENGNTTTTDYAGNLVYENNSLQFIGHSEGYLSNGKYVYQYKDHLGNVRLSYSDTDLDGTIDPSTEIIEESNYYPFGLEHKGYNNVVNGVENNYKTFQGKEHQKELNLNWHDFGARQYDATLGRWMSPDPLSEEFSNWSPYTAMNDNPINFIDPTGLAAEWIPKVNENGSVSYIAENGDSAKSLSDQYGIKQSDAEKITGTTGSTKIKEGTKVTGEKVASVIEGNDNGILKLDTTDKNTTNDDIVKQVVFAVRNENVQENLGNAGVDGEFGSGNIYDYFTTSKSSKVTGAGAFYGFDTGRRRTTLKIGDYSFSLAVGVSEQSNGRFSRFVGNHRQVPQAGGSYAEFIDFNYPKSKNKSSRGLRGLTSRVIGIRVYSGNSRILRNHLDGK